MGHAGVVDHQVGCAEIFQAGRGQGFDVGRARDIATQGHDLGTQARQLGLGRVQRILLHVGDDQVQAFAGAQAGEFQAKAAAGTGDDGRLPGL